MKRKSEEIQFMILKLLKKYNKPLSFNKIRDELITSRVTVIANVRSLQKRGDVITSKNVDRNINYVEITERGLGTLKIMKKSFNQN